MAYDYSSESKTLELPNPYVIENRLMFVCSAALIAAGVVSLIWTREALMTNTFSASIAPLLVGIVLLAAGIGYGAVGAGRLRFFFGRGRPASLAPEVAIGATGNSDLADKYKTLLRQGALEYDEPKGALNNFLYHKLPDLITAPSFVQQLAQRHFYNALALVVTFISFVVAWAVLGDDLTRPWVAVLYYGFSVAILLRPLAARGKARMSTITLIVLIVFAVLGSVAIGLLAKKLPTLNIALHGHTFFLLISALIAVTFIFLALQKQVRKPPPTERSSEQVALSMNGPPGAIITELDREFQNSWTERIPNRRYTRLEPVTNAAEGSGRFAGELFEESQPMPQTGASTASVTAGMANSHHRWLVCLDAFGTFLVLLGTAFALYYVKQFDTTSVLFNKFGIQAPISYAFICLLVAVFCFQSASAVWGRFVFESTLVWVELLGVWQSSQIGTGNQMNSQLQTRNDVVRIESMTLRVWRARIESVVFGKDDARQVTAMYASQKEAKDLASHLAEFARQQSVFIAPQASADLLRVNSLKGFEGIMNNSSDQTVSSLAQSAGVANIDLQVDQMHKLQLQFCPGCGTKAAAQSKFCSSCGSKIKA